MVALTRSIAVDSMRRGIRCNAVAPGTVDSPWVGRIIADQADPVAARTSMVQRPAARPPRAARGDRRRDPVPGVPGG